MSRTSLTTECLYCRIQLPDTASFCPQCGRPIETGFAIRRIQGSGFDGLRKAMKERETLMRRQGFSSSNSYPQTQAHMEEGYVGSGSTP